MTASPDLERLANLRAAKDLLGWQNFTSSPGPFKNQGDCVSSFASGGKNEADK